MDLQSAEIKEILVEDGTTMARVYLEGELVSVPILFLSRARVGDIILIESGVAVSTLGESPVREGVTE